MNDANDMNQYPEGYTEDDMDPFKDVEWYDFGMRLVVIPLILMKCGRMMKEHKKWNGNLSIGNVKFVTKYIKKHL